MKSKPGPSRGVLNLKEGEKHFRVNRHIPDSEITYFVEYFWTVRWDLRGKDPYKQDVLSHPSVHLVFEKDNTKIWGVVTGKFTRVIKDKGHVLGIKFRPGGFFPFYKKPVGSFSDKVLSFNDVFEDDLEHLEEEILPFERDEPMVRSAEAFLQKHLPDPDPKVKVINKMVDGIMQDASILKVEDLIGQYGFGKRTLQRLFRQYVGVSPKWVIQRYRLHEAAEKMAAGEADNWPALAVDLGYFDQAHFIRDFKAIVGQSPAEYARHI